MKSVLKRFGWEKCLQFWIPYTLAVKVFYPEQSWPIAILAGMLLGSFLSLLMGKNCPEDQKGQCLLPETIYIQYDSGIKLLCLIPLYLGLFLGSLLAILSLMVDLLKLQGHQDFPGIFYALFFFAVAILCYFAKLGIQHSCKIGPRGILKREKKWWGFQEHFTPFESIESVSVNFWGVLIIRQKNGTLLTFSVPIGKDFSFYRGMDIPTQEIKNHNFIGSYQIQRELERRIRQNQIEPLAS